MGHARLVRSTRTGGRPTSGGCLGGKGGLQGGVAAEGGNEAPGSDAGEFLPPATPGSAAAAAARCRAAEEEGKGGASNRSQKKMLDRYLACLPSQLTMPVVFGQKLKRGLEFLGRDPSGLGADPPVQLSLGCPALMMKIFFRNDSDDEDEESDKLIVLDKTFAPRKRTHKMKKSLGD